MRQRGRQGGGSLTVRTWGGGRFTSLSLLVALMCVAAAALGAPAAALAAEGDYSIDELSTEITVQPNATAHVVERQTLTFDTRSTGVVWYLHVPESGESVRISSVKAAPVDDGCTQLGDWTRLQMIDSDPRRQGRVPGDSAMLALRVPGVQPWYSYNIGDGMLRCYFPTGAQANLARPAAGTESAAGATAAGATAASDGSEGPVAGEESVPATEAPSTEEPAAEALVAKETAGPAPAGATDPAVVAGPTEAAVEAAAVEAAAMESAEDPTPTGPAAATDGQAATEPPTEEGSPESVSASALAVAAAGADYRTYEIETDYTVAHRVRVYRDVAELYWRYVNDSLPADSNEVNLQIRLPVPPELESDSDALAASIHAWGHGPSDGTFAIGDDGTVTYHLDRIGKGSYAEAHLIFPASWMTDMAPGAANRFDTLRERDAMAEEAQWVDTAQREMAWDNNVRVLFLGLAGAIILVGFLGALRRGRSPLTRRALIRTAATLGVTALGEHLFFREPLTTLVLVALALVVAVIAWLLPLLPDAAEEAEEAEEATVPEVEGAAAAAKGAGAAALGEAGEAVE